MTQGEIREGFKACVAELEAPGRLIRATDAEIRARGDAWKLSTGPRRRAGGWLRRVLAERRELIGILRAYCDCLDMSDCDHPAFADSGADVVDALWHRADARELLARVTRREG